VRLSTNAVQALCKLLRRSDLAIGGRDLGDLVDQDGGQRGTDAQRATGNKPILAAGFGAIAEGSPSNELEAVAQHHGADHPRHRAACR
jgi:hypothetical protein